MTGLAVSSAIRVLVIMGGNLVYFGREKLLRIFSTFRVVTTIIIQVFTYSDNSMFSKNKHKQLSNA